MTAADLATVAVAAVAIVELWRAGEQRRARTKAANVKVSAVGYALRRQITSWLIEYKVQSEADAARHAQRHFDVAEAQAQDMIATGVDASKAVQEAIREFYARFYRATDTINRQLLLYQTTQVGPSVFGLRGRWPDPKTDLQNCVALLDRIVEPALQNVDDRLAAKLEAEVAKLEAGQAESRSGTA